MKRTDDKAAEGQVVALRQTRSVVASKAPWSPPRWLETWQAMMPVPVSADEVARALADAEAVTAPADRKTIAALIAETLELYGLPDNWERVAKFYVEVFEDVPPDLVAKAMKAHRLSPKPFFPKPGELRAHISEELARRFTTLMRLRLAKGSVKPPAPPRRELTDEERARVDAVLARLKKPAAE